MWIAETIDLEDHDSVVKFMKNKSDKIKKLKEENEQLKKSNQKLNDELQETMGYLALKSGVEKENEQLKSELDYWKKRALLLEHKYDESAVEWLRNNTVWEQMPSSIRTSVSTAVENPYCDKRKVKKR